VGVAVVVFLCALNYYWYLLIAGAVFRDLKGKKNQKNE
jgi:hypothetical protein